MENYLIYNDKKRLKQMLVNMLNNAMKFTIKGKIALTIEE
jgi:signal transduction histidine kinase